MKCKWDRLPTNLHCSQTIVRQRSILLGLFPLRIYTALKPYAMPESSLAVCFPYEFTLLSNSPVAMLPIHKFVSPTNLHCSQTVLISTKAPYRFVSPTNLHCSQTSNCLRIIFCKISASIHRSHPSSLY